MTCHVPTVQLASPTLQSNTPATTPNGRNSPISLFGSRQLSSLQLIISSKPEVGIPYSVILPLEDNLNIYTFVIDQHKIKSTSIQFDVYPTFGSKVIGRSVVLPQTLGLSGGGNIVKVSSPLFDTQLKVVGELNFDCLVVKPFEHPCLSIGGKIQTYWKTTVSAVESASKGLYSYITASSLAEAYIHVCVSVTLDGITIILPSFWIDLNDIEGESPDFIAVGSLTWKQVQRLLKKKDCRQVLLDCLAGPDFDIDKISNLVANSGLALSEALSVIIFNVVVAQ